MNLDNQRIAIRERGIFEIMDLALHVLRAQAMPLIAVLVLGATPMIFLSRYLLSDLLTDARETEEWIPAQYIHFLLLVTAIQSPLVTAPATVLLGRATFGESTTLGQLLGELFRSAPQFILFQIVLRAISMPLCIMLPVLPYVGWPFLGEIVLLERNSLFKGRTGRLTTFRRATNFHSGVFSEVLSRWFASLLIGGALVASIWLSMWALISQLVGKWQTTETAYGWLLPIALWIVVGFFTVVRFLSYLDLRIRREGWEVELAVRAEGARLAAALVRP
jgi:hypothetical protein